MARPAPVIAASSPGPLQNELVILGTGAGPPPVPHRTGISSALKIDDKIYIVDCGRSSVTQFVNAGLSLEAIRAIFITHLHADHTCDLFNFFLLGSGTPPPEDSLRTPTPVFGPGSPGLPLPPAYPPGRQVATVDPSDPTPGIAALLRRCNDAFAYSTNVLMRDSGLLDIATLIDARETPLPNVGASPLGPTAPAMKPVPIATLGNVVVTGTLVPHGICFPSYAYRFDTPYGSVVFSGDTALTPNLIALARDADILVHEAIAFEWFADHGYTADMLSHMKTSHTDIVDVAGVAKAAGVKTVIVSHLGPANPFLVSNAQWEQFALRGARKVNYRGQIVIGQDLTRYTLDGRRIS